MGPKSGTVGWGGVRLSQTRPIPRSPDGDNKHNAAERWDLEFGFQTLALALAFWLCYEIIFDFVCSLNQYPAFLGRLACIVEMISFSVWPINVVQIRLMPSTRFDLEFRIKGRDFSGSPSAYVFLLEDGGRGELRGNSQIRK